MSETVPASRHLIARHARSALWLARYMERIENLAQTDSLTGLYNVRMFNEVWQREHEACERNRGASFGSNGPNQSSRSGSSLFEHRPCCRRNCDVGLSQNDRDAGTNSFFVFGFNP